MSTVARISARLVIPIGLTLALFAPALVAQQKPAGRTAGRGAIKPVTAKAHLNEAMAAARVWQADAFLIQVTGGGVNLNGAGLSWDYGVYSPSARKCATINVMNGQSNTAEAGGPECAKAKIGDFIDSDKAMGIGLENGLNKSEVAMTVANSPYTGKQVIWMLIEDGLRDKNDVEIHLDGATGHVIGVRRRP